MPQPRQYNPRTEPSYQLGHAAFYTPEETGHPHTWEIADRVEHPAVFCNRDHAFRHALSQGVNIERAQAWTHVPDANWSPWKSGGASGNVALSDGPQHVVHDEANSQGGFNGWHFGPESERRKRDRHQDAEVYSNPADQAYHPEFAHWLTHCAHCGTPV